MACPPVDAGCSGFCFTLPLTTGTGFGRSAAGLATTQSLSLVAFAGLLDGGTGFGIGHPNGYDEFDGTLIDLDARFGQALAVRSTGIALFDGGSWSLVTPPPNTAVGACQTGAIYGNAGTPSRVVYCKGVDGGYGAYPLAATGAWQSVVPVPLPGFVTPDSSRVRPSGSNGVLIAHAGSDWYSAWVPTGGTIQSAVMPNASNVMVSSNDAQVPWVAGTTPVALHLWQVSGHISQFPPVGVSPFTGQFQLLGVAASGADARAVAFRSIVAQSMMVEGQVINLNANEATLLTLRSTTVYVTRLGTAVDKVWLGFTTPTNGPFLQVVINCSGQGSIACSGTMPGALHFSLRIP